MALLGKTSCKAAVFLAALVVMATAFSSSHAAQGQGNVGEEKMACKPLQGCNTEMCMGYCQTLSYQGGTCIHNDPDMCCCPY
uniref:Knottin scorpion toxin-like domain-containing protein n=1 Tax=Oryza rufipogon TaxID=4529 RepID=A0A0E0P211_ORYRU